MTKRGKSLADILVILESLKMEADYLLYLLVFVKLTQQSIVAMNLGGLL